MIPVKSFIFGALVFVCSGVTITLQAIELQYDPFSYLDTPLVKAHRNANTAPRVVQKVNWRPELRATIVAGAMSLANINGTVLRIGEKFDGFTLIKVSNQTATFEKNQSRVILKMRAKLQKK